MVHYFYKFITVVDFTLKSRLIINIQENNNSNNNSMETEIKDVSLLSKNKIIFFFSKATLYFNEYNSIYLCACAYVCTCECYNNLNIYFSYRYEGSKEMFKKKSDMHENMHVMMN